MLEYWYLFPAGVAIAICAMSSGIEGSSFWTPVYLLAMGLEPKVAFWVSLLTMFFGFGSGVWRNLRDGTVNAYLVGRYLLVAAPAAALGALASARIGAFWLLAGFAVFVLTYGALLIREYVRRDPLEEALEPHERVYRSVGALAGGLQGTIASGAGVLLMPAILNHRRSRHHAEAVGSTVVLVFVLSLVSVSLRVDATLFATLVAGADEILRMIVFAAPGVVLGGQLGPRLARRLSRRHLRLWVGVLLTVVGVLVGYRALAA
ncbi:MAG TPA: sulfite exporter TauE/SafE family protein [Thermoanaerobaculia bacterium]